jgi:GNAT superfamily N-acetyltransferase
LRIRLPWGGRRAERDADPRGALAALGPQIAALAPDSGPDLILSTHHELLAAFGRSFGYGFHPQPPIEAPSDQLISVFGRLDPRARQREFSLWICEKELEDGTSGRRADIVELFLPERCRGRGAGTTLIEALLELWTRIGVREVRATASGDGSCAFAAWGFALAREDSMTPPRLVREELRRRAGLERGGTPGSMGGQRGVRVPDELREELGRLLGGEAGSGPLLDIGALYRLTTADGGRYGRALLHGVMWPARRHLGP